jgi:hypothetical protein
MKMVVVVVMGRRRKEGEEEGNTHTTSQSHQYRRFDWFECWGPDRVNDRIYQDPGTPTH